MNDKFNDRIRQKLEDLQPTYREKDWVRMQSYLHQHGFPPAWSGASRWLQPVATGLTAASLLVAIVWQYQTNRELQTKLDSLTQTVTRLEQSQTALQQTPLRADTVYIARVNPVQPQQTPSLSTNTSTLTEGSTTNAGLPRPRSNRTAADVPQPIPSTDGTSDALTSRVTPDRVTLRQSSPASGASDGTSDANQTESRQTRSVPASDAVTRSPNAPGALPNQKTIASGRVPNQSDPARTEPTGLTTPDASVDKLANADKPTNATQPAETPGATTGATSAGGKPPGSPASDQRTARNRMPGGTSPGRERRTTERIQTGRESDALPTNPPATDVLGTSETATGRPDTQLAVAPLQPLTIQPNTDALITRFNRRARRIKPTAPSAPVTLVAVQTPKQKAADVTNAEPVSVRPTPSGQIRIGGAAEVGTNQQSVGAYGEVLLGRHWSVGVGLNRIWLPSERFVTEVQFRTEKRHDFRRDFGRGVTYIHDILDITLQGYSWQVPISANYRLPMKRGFVLTSSVGANLSVYTQEQATYLLRLRYIPIPQPGPGPKPGYDKDRIVEFRQQQSNNFYHSWMVSAGVEKQVNRFVFQASPYITIPFWIAPSSLNNTSVGVRARVLFQF
ncbi:hypothetical protein DYU11_03235 [Fibrisoma montanum]|uniref:Outer membrane protein beta-barrel domain-containing protein n=1 Tax=Fibrisoma montanum TaxID=2305895 RepID=A0A418MIT4_9BACT|nr:hypothetical protein [Fibrisoma montanum]RIV27340.1 hypothetical protein DYU11_03235 [Fibrisoma montanum]